MKPTRGLSQVPEGLRRYCADTTKTQTWTAFRKDGDGRQAYDELSTSLVTSQRHLCCYCEIDLIVPDDRQIEHVQSRNRHPHRALDHTNMLASCLGGSKASLTVHPDRYLPERADSLSCGQKKENVDTLDPRDLPTHTSLFVVTMDGRLIPDQAACIGHGISVDDARAAIETLGLNAPRLVKAREKIRRALAAYDGYALPLKEIEARQQLLPDAYGKLLPWFTTRRSYFGAIANFVLGTPPQDWIGA
jgi:uncharacterized protein (TIGR02646 family)